MTKLSNILKYWWLTILSASILSQLFEGVLIIDIIVAIFSFILSIFYFYGSPFYFLDIKFRAFKRNLGEYRLFTKVFATMAGLPFAITAISVAFLLFRFPGAQLIYLIGVVIFIACYIISLYNLSKDADIERWKFIHHELNWLGLYNMIVIVLIVLSWSDNPLNLNWSNAPSNAPRY